MSQNEIPTSRLIPDGPLSPGKTLVNRYRLAARIGRGGMGEVWRAYDQRLRVEIALKALHGDLTDDLPRLEQARREVLAAREVTSVNVCRTFDLVETEGHVLIAMELVSGVTLLELLRRRGPLEPREAILLAGPLLDGLEAIHQAGLVHRDVKLENVMVTPEGRIVIMDLGLAQSVAADPTGSVAGTPVYMAPEQARGGSLDARADVYSVGVVLAEMTSPGGVASTAERQRIWEGVRHSPPTLADGPWRDCITRALAWDPDARPASARGLQAGLAAALEASVAIVPAPEFPLPIREVDAFVGRDAELARLNELLARVRTGDGQVAFVVGESGSGKSALLHHFSRIASEGDPTLLVARGSSSSPTQAGNPFLPFREVLALMTGRLEGPVAAGEITAEQARRLWETVPLAADAILDKGQDLIEVLVSGPHLVERLEGCGRTEAAARLRALLGRSDGGSSDRSSSHLLEQYGAVLERIALEHPLVVVLDDLQWADGSTIDLLFHLSRRLEGRRILLLGAHRPEEVELGRSGERHPLDKVLAELRRYRGDVVVSLEDAGSAEQRALVDALIDLEPNDLDVAFRRILHRHTEGHPLFAIEMLADLKERRLLVQDATGRWSAPVPIDWGALPERVEGVLHERFGRMPDDLRELLAVAGVEGLEFTPAILARVQGVGEREVLRTLSRELEKRHRVVKESEELKIGSATITRFRFTHAVFQRYVYDELSGGERRILHAEVAAGLEQLHADDPEAISVELAHHHREAGNVDDELRCLELAGSRARRLYADQQALFFFDRGLALARSADERSTFQRGRAQSLLSLYRGEEAAREFEILVEAARDRHDAGAETDSLLGLAAAQYVVALNAPDSDAPSRSRALYAQAHELAAREEDRPRMVRALLPTSWFIDFWPDYAPTAHANAEKALALSRDLGDARLVQESREAVTNTLRLLGRLFEAEEVGEVLAADLAARDDPRRLKETCFLLMWIHLHRGNLNRCIARCDQGLALADRLGVPPVQYPTLKALALLQQGRYAEAREALEQEPAGSEQSLSRAFRGLALGIYNHDLMLGPTGSEVLGDVVLEGKRLKRVWLWTWALARRVECLLGFRPVDHPDVVAALTELAAAPEGIPSHLEATVALARGDHASALPLAQSAVDAAHRDGRRGAWIDALHLEGQVLLASGDPRAAAEVAVEARSTAVAIGSPPRQWRLWLLDAECRDALGDVAAAASARTAATSLIEDLAQQVTDATDRESFRAAALAMGGGA